MVILASALVGLVALEHIYFLVLEMFLWTKPKTLVAFKMTKEYADATKTLAANQGLYNGFLAAGLIFGLFGAAGGDPRCFKIFFLSCVVVAGIYGGATVGKKIFLLQALPAMAGLIAVFLSGS